MNENGKSLLKSAGLAFVLLVATYFTCGFYYEEIEGFFDAMYTGKLSPGYPFPSWYYMGHIGISYFYSFLYQHVPGVEWMSWILYIYMWVSCSLLLFLVHFLLKNKYSNWLIVAIQVLVYVLLFADNVVHFQWTRIGAFMSAASLLCFVFLFPTKESIAKHRGVFVLLNVFFVIATLTRLECAMAVTFFIGAFALYYQHNFFQTLRLFIFPVLVVLGVLGGIMLDINRTDSFYKKVEPDIETQITVRSNVVPLSHMQTRRDSLRYTAGVNMLWGDPDIITVDFLRSLLTHDQQFFANPKQWQRTRGTLVELYETHKALVVYNALLIAITFVFVFLSGKPRALLYLLYCASFVVLVVMQIYFVKINERSFFPLLAIFSYINLVVALTFGGRAVMILIGLVTLPVLISRVTETRQNVQMMKAEWETHDKNMQILRAIAKDQIIVLNTSTIRFFTVFNKPFYPFDYSSFNKVYINEAQVLTTIPAYANYLQNDCQCDVRNFSNFFRYLQQVNNKQVYFLSSTTRMELITRYLKGIHNFELNIEEVKEPELVKIYDHERSGILDLKLYTFQKKTH